MKRLALPASLAVIAVCVFADPQGSIAQSPKKTTEGIASKGPIITVVNETRVEGCNPEVMPLCAEPQYESIRYGTDYASFYHRFSWTYMDGSNEGNHTGAIYNIKDSSALNLSATSGYNWKFHGNTETRIHAGQLMVGNTCGGDSLPEAINSHLNKKEESVHLSVYVTFAEEEFADGDNAIVSHCKVVAENLEK